MALRMESRTSSWLWNLSAILLATWSALGAVKRGECQVAAAPETLEHSYVMAYLDDEGRVRPVETVDDWSRRRRAILVGVEGVMGELPNNLSLVPLDVEIESEKKTLEYKRVRLSYISEPGDRVPADLYVPTDRERGSRLPAVLALHPTGALGKRIVAGEGPRSNRQYAIELARRGYVVLAPDYPSFGEYPYDFDEDRHPSGSIKGVINHSRGVDLLAAHPVVDPDRIGVIGHSLGGHNAIFLALFDARVRTIVSSCGWDPFRTYQGGDLNGWSSPRYMPRIQTRYNGDPSRVPFEFDELIAALAPRPFFSSSPLEDDNFDAAGVRVAIREARRVYDLFEAGDQLQLVQPPCGHDFPPEIRAEAYAFLDRSLEHQPTPNRDVAPDFEQELPRIPPSDPESARDALDVADEFDVQIAAAEPLVVDPIALAFDASGRVYVIEMRGYSEQRDARLGRIRLMEDLDHDGILDQSQVFAEGLCWPTAIYPYDDGIFVAAAPEIRYLKDLDGDGQADVDRVVFDGFGYANVQGLLNSFHWGLDNRIHGATSSSGGRVTRPDRPDLPAVELNGRDFSFDPKTLDLRAESGGAQHGLSFDAWGQKYVCSNSDHIQQVMFDLRYAKRNRWLVAPTPRTSIAVDGPQAEVFRQSPIEPWRIVRTRLRVSGRVRGPVEGGGRAAGYFTGATGILIYEGDAWPDRNQGLAFIGDVGSNLVHRKQIVRDGVVARAERIDRNSEFLTSRDNWFRPVQLANAPDGNLWVLDMAREVIEHPKSLPPMIKRHLDLNSGSDRGRLYRIIHKDSVVPTTRPVDLDRSSSRELVALLAHRNAWHRQTASRLLYERDDRRVVPMLQQMAVDDPEPLGRLHALGTLDGLEGLTVKIIALALTDAHPQIRRHALRWSERFDDDPTIGERMVGMVDDPDPEVRYQLAFTAGAFPTAIRIPILRGLTARDAGDPWSRFAILSALVNGGGPFIQAVVHESHDLKAAQITLLEECALMLGRQADPDELERALHAIAEAPNDAFWIPPVFRALSMGLRYSIGPQIMTEADLKTKDSSRAWTRIYAIQRERLLARAWKSLEDSEATTSARIEAVRLVASSAPEPDRLDLVRWLTPSQPESLQSAILDVMGDEDDPTIADVLLQRWSSLTPALRTRCVRILGSRHAWQSALLDALEDETFAIEGLDPSSLNGLEAVLDDEFGARLRRLRHSHDAGNDDRLEVLTRYRSALAKAGDPNRGRLVFERACATCHRFQENGGAIGPQLDAIASQGREAILTHILDPNREVDPRYRSYLAATVDGRTYSGILTAQSSTRLQLTTSDGTSVPILLTDLEELKSSDRSLMPEGLETQINVDQMSDLLSYLMRR